MVAELQVSREINFMMSLCVPVIYIIHTSQYSYIHTYIRTCVYIHVCILAYGRL